MKLKMMVGTLSLIVMLSTPTLAQAQIISDKSLVVFMVQPETVGQAKQLPILQAQAKALNIDITGLSNDYARSKIKAVERANTLTHLLAQAKTLGIGIG